MAITIFPNGTFSTGSLITEVDQWYLNQNATSGVVPGTYWTRKLKIGTGMTVSQDANGRWVFPSTGIWRISWSISYITEQSDNVY